MVSDGYAIIIATDIDFQVIKFAFCPNDHRIVVALTKADDRIADDFVSAANSYLIVLAIIRDHKAAPIKEFFGGAV